MDSLSEVKLTWFCKKNLLQFQKPGLILGIQKAAKGPHLVVLLIRWLNGTELF